jgi:hypothetical protein
LTNLWHYRLGFDDLDALVMIYKNKSNDAQTDCKLVEECVIKFFCEKKNYLMNMRKNFKKKANLRTSKKTLWFHVHSCWKSFPNHIFVTSIFHQPLIFFHLKGLGYVLKKNCDYVWPHEPLINDIHYCRFLDLCWSIFWWCSNWLTWFIKWPLLFSKFTTHWGFDIMSHANVIILGPL